MKIRSKVQAGNTSSKRHIIALGLVGLSIALAYANSLSGTWAMDDVVANRPVGIRDLNDFIGFRKVTYLSFLVNQQIGSFSAVNYRIFNILIHFMNAVLVYVLACRTMATFGDGGGGAGDAPGRKAQEARRAGSERAFTAALLSSVIFALHPININAVAYIIQRLTSMAAFFVLLALLLYREARMSAGMRSYIFYLLCCLSVMLGVFSKENAIMAVPLLALYDVIFLSRTEGAPFLKRAGFVSVLAIVCVGIVSYALELHRTVSDLVFFALNPTQPMPERAWMAVNVYWTPLQHVLTAFRVVTRYLLLVFLPLPQLLVFDWWSFPVSTGLLDPPATVLAMILLLSLTGFALWGRRRFPFLSFGILWYLISISLESFAALGTDLYFEHRNYLPVAGLVIGLVGQAALSLERVLTGRRIVITAVVVAFILGSLTAWRNVVWKDSSTLWADAVEKHGDNIRARMSLGNARLMVSDFEGAKRQYREAVALSMRDRRERLLNDSAYRLGMALLLERNTGEAKKLLDSVEGMIESYHMNILKAFYDAVNGNTDTALRQYLEILPQVSYNDAVVLHTLIGDAYRSKGMWDNAISAYMEALGMDGMYAAAHYGTGVSYMGKGDIKRAKGYFLDTLTLTPDHVLALSDMAELILVEKSGPEEALSFAGRAVYKSPPFYQPYLTMGNALIVSGRETEAGDFYREATVRGAPPYLVPFSKARAYYLRGDREAVERELAELRKYKDLPEGIKRIIR